MNGSIAYVGAEARINKQLLLDCTRRSNPNAMPMGWIYESETVILKHVIWFTDDSNDEPGAVVGSIDGNDSLMVPLRVVIIHMSTQL